MYIYLNSWGELHRMELIMINDNKLKVTLSIEDMKALDIDCETLDYDNTETRRAFWSILDEAKHRTGFDAAADKVFVQVYPSQDGGCEMYVTKLSSYSGDDKRTITIKNRNKSRVKRDKSQCQPKVFRFDGIQSLIGLCSRLYTSKTIYISSVYASADTNSYFLEISLPDDVQANSELDAYIGEYGGKKCGNSINLYLNEYCSCLRKNDAVETLGVLN